jgi:large subunit ribosomal protein L17
MRHLVAHRKLGRNQGHRKALLRNLVISLIERERITTTLQKAKEARSMAEKMVTLGKKGTLHHRRLAYKFLTKKIPLKKLFDEIAPRFSEREGGYTRIIRLSTRKGDGAEMAILEFVDYEFKKKAKKKKS